NSSVFAQIDMDDLNDNSDTQTLFFASVEKKIQLKKKSNQTGRRSGDGRRFATSTIRTNLIKEFCKIERKREIEMEERAKFYEREREKAIKRWSKRGKRKVEKGVIKK